MRVFPAPFCTGLAEGATCLQGACHVLLSLPVKFRQNRFRVGRAISEKVTSYHTITVYAFGIITVTCGMTAKEPGSAPSPTLVLG